MRADGVDEAAKEDRVAEVGCHLTTFCDGSCHDGGQGTGECKLKEPNLHWRFPGQEKPSVADESFSLGDVITY